MPTNSFKKLKVYFVPESYKNDVLIYRKAENVIEATLVGIFLLAFLFPFNYLLGLEATAWFALFDIAFLFLSLYAFKKGIKLYVFGNSLSLSAYLLVLTACLETGGIFSPAISAFVVSGIIAFFYTGKRLGFLWTIISLFSVGFLGAWESLGLSKLQSKLLPEDTVFFAISVNLILIVFSMYLVNFYVSILKNINKRNFLRTEKMERFHQILAEHQSEIEEKNKELTNLYEQFNKQNQDLLLQKELLQTQNDELTRAYEELIDSIYYTKRIQVALLPHIELIKPHFTDFMVLYKPKEILSGDFYWFAHINEYSFLVVADCTGHGIPGAFMTVIGNDLLNHIIKEEHTFSPQNILKRLDEELFKTLQQEENYKEGNISDGMDIAICRIHTKQKEICFAGAKRPLFVVNQQEVNEIKGCRFGIGGMSGTKKHFKEHHLLAKSDDVFYMSSDGFTDQFGGDSDSKFLTVHFKEKLKQLYNKPLEYQKIYLDELHETWKGFINEQTDDILVIGFKV
ncbi:MAG: hypothetical protein OHK0045_21530 [Raineya sp.]